MRILHLIPTLGGGGAERQLGLLAPALAQSGVEIGVAYHGGGPNLDLLCRSTVDLFPLPRRGNYHPMQLWDIGSLVSRWRPDAIQTWLPQMDILGGMVAHFTRTPHILSERSSASMYADSLKIAVRTRMGRLARAIIANSQGGADYWYALGAHSQIIVIPNAMPPLKDDISPHPWPGKRYFVMAGRFSPEKNAVTAARALVMALEASPDMHAAILGDGPDREMVSAVVTASTVAQRVRMVGYSNDVNTWLRHAAAYVSSSYVEGHPNVVLEAAQALCPLILSDIPAHREAIGEGAAYVAADDVAGYASALGFAIDAPVETARRIESARARVDMLALGTITERYALLYRELLETNLR